MTLKKIDMSTITKVVKNCTTPKQKIDISTKWESQLPYYAQIYSRLNNEGQKEMLRQLSAIGKLVDRMQAMRKEKENETK